MNLPKYIIVYADNNEPIFPNPKVKSMHWEENGEVSSVSTNLSFYYNDGNGKFFNPSHNVEVKIKHEK